ncbi:hypothetical protein ymoll0001_1560 [Yersinia mollaretii ATCC 43969]|uniref:Uncharacterized protein n=1 Tax=Yersinia mollaretii (strain ATCC 43969 / DSM 18520 / CIP 103324 / CNY 7263 / WAIP 204) TaxID=349967 RepID=A0ABM9Y736_YERMW|nr:hypothetical protein ymoll0001_1560 [Yersinia mollaretii ATCC 43969]
MYFMMLPDDIFDVKFPHLSLLLYYTLPTHLPRMEVIGQVNVTYLLCEQK